ncbi:uncharacterized protein METZ01_LOCUS296801, partial [marine metagenome]
MQTQTGGQALLRKTLKAISVNARRSTAQSNHRLMVSTPSMSSPR